MFQGAKNFVSSAGEKIAGGANYVKEKFAKAGKFVDLMLVRLH